MPKGIYLNAWTLGPKLLAQKMNTIINDKNKYYNFFKWHGYYTFHYTGEDNYHREVCGLCEFLNNRSPIIQRRVFSNITQWWNEAPTATTTETPMFVIAEDEDNTLQGLLLRIINFIF